MRTHTRTTPKTFRRGQRVAVPNGEQGIIRDWSPTSIPRSYAVDFEDGETDYFFAGQLQAVTPKKDNR